MFEKPVSAESVLTPHEKLFAYIQSKAGLPPGRYNLQVQVEIPVTKELQESALYGAKLEDTEKGQVLIIEAADETGKIQRYVSVEGSIRDFKQQGTASTHQIHFVGFSTHE
ncbi:MAG: hypothetical protein RLZZ360_877 [Candidatus Parcubacteria bacterium]|jgi:hypothetical protein